jgi:hypothetical protein
MHTPSLERLSAGLGSKANGFVAGRGTALVQRILNIAKQDRKPGKHHAAQPEKSDGVWSNRNGLRFIMRKPHQSA